MLSYNVAGRNGTVTATADRPYAILWNASSAKSIYVTEIGVTKTVATVDNHEIMKGLGYTIPSDTARVLTEYKYADDVVDDVVDEVTDDTGDVTKLYSKPNQAQKSPLPMTNIPAYRWQTTESIPEYGVRGMTLYSDKRGASDLTKSFYAQEGQAVGGKNLVEQNINVQKPLVINSSDFMGYDIPRAEAGPGAIVKLKGQQYYDTLQSNLGTILSANGDIKQSYLVQELERLIPEDDLNKLLAKFDEVRNSADSYEAYSYLEDRLGAALAKKEGYDSILTIAGSSGNQYYNEIAMLDPIRAISKEVRDQIYDPRMTDEVIKLGLQAKDWNAVRKAESLKRGFTEPDLADPMLDYVMHRLTPEAEDHITGQFKGKGYGRKYSSFHASAFNRTLLDPGISVKAANDLTEAGKGGELSKVLEGFKGKLFLDDPGEVNLIRDMRSIHSTTNTQTIIDAAQRIGVHKDKAPADWVPLHVVSSTDPRDRLLAPIVQDLRFPPNIAEDMNKLVKWDQMPEMTNKYVDILHDAWQTWNQNWKGTALNFHPQTFLRNMSGAIWNTILGGDNPKWMTTARSILRGTEQGPIKLGNTFYRPEQLNKMRQEFGIGNGLATIESSGFYAKKSPLLYRIPGIGKAAQLTYKANMALESTIRFGQFLSALDRGMEPLTAASHVKKYQIDYLTGNTDFERILNKYVFPFYTWTRHNTQVQLSSLINNPQPFLQLSHLIGLAKDNQAARKLDENEGIIADYLKEGLNIPTRMGEDGRVEVWVMGGWTPVSDLENINPKTGLSKAYQMLNPIWKLFIDEASGIDTFLNRKIENFPGEKERYMGVDLRKRLTRVFNVLRPLQSLDKMSDAYFNEELGKKDASVVKQVFKTLFGYPVTTIDLRQNRMSRIIAIRDMQDELRKLKRKANQGDPEAAANINELQNYIDDLKRGWK